MVEHGTLDFEVALSEPAFVSAAYPAGQLQATPQDVDGFRRELHQLVDNSQFRDANDARAAVAAAANLAHDKLHLSATSAVLEYTGGAAGALDEYSTFLTPDQLNDLYSQIEGNFVGLGVELKAADSALLIVNVIHGSPAERAGLKAADRIIAVAGHSTHQLSTDQAAELLQGAEGTSVDLTAVTADEPARSLTLRREHVDVPSVDNIRIIDEANGVGYFKLACFQKTTSRDLDNALWQLHRQGMRSLVMDLRGNPGGLLTAAVDAADKFIDQGNIVSTRGRSPQEDYNYTAHSMNVWHLPLVVLIDGDSASASEIFAGAVRDHAARRVGRHAELRQGLGARHLPAGRRRRRHPAYHGEILFPERPSVCPRRRRARYRGASNRQADDRRPSRPSRTRRPRRDSRRRSGSRPAAIGAAIGEFAAIVVKGDEGISHAQPPKRSRRSRKRISRTGRRPATSGFANCCTPRANG